MLSRLEMSAILTYVGWLTVAVFGYVVLISVLAAFFPRRCPECGEGKLAMAGGCKYTRRDCSGHKGGGYVIFKCQQCSKSFLDWRGKLTLLAGDDPDDAAHRIVFDELLHSNACRST